MSLFAFCCILPICCYFFIFCSLRLVLMCDSNTKNIFRNHKRFNKFTFFKHELIHIIDSFVTLNRISRFRKLINLLFSACQANKTPIRFDCRYGLPCPESFPKSEKRPKLGEIFRSYVRSSS